MEMQVGELTDAQHAALVACLRIFAEIGANEESEQKAKTADALGSAATVLAETNGTPLLPKESTDAGS